MPAHIRLVRLALLLAAGLTELASPAAGSERVIGTARSQRRHGPWTRPVRTATRRRQALELYRERVLEAVARRSIGRNTRDGGGAIFVRGGRLF